MLEMNLWKIGSRLASCLLILLCGAASAQTYPAHAIRLIVPLTPGGPTDRTARLLAQSLTEVLKQPVIVENRSGAGSMLGTEYVAKSPPDGYTLGMSSQSSISLGPLMRSVSSYDPIKDFAHIAMVGAFPMFLMVRTAHPAKTFQEFLSIARARPGAVTYGTAGIGSLGNLLGGLINQTAGVTLAHVAYKGVAPSITDALGGHIDATYIADSTAAEFVRSGKMRMLATTADQRVSAFPDVPTMDEIVPGVHGSLWYGVSAPAKTPQPVLDRLETEILASIRSSEVQAGLIGIGLTPVPLGSRDFLQFIRSEMGKWGPVIKAGNIKRD